ncbi:hypothetical protein QWY75_01640 [Pontixanthobacter aestiaquae]|uniref:Uncharacterized protein n=1 Tax=Pontixanthobacter aestiaquae TaxID=1509367 RepID=A0A844ZA69_9SPHN|nr:hypothetical protein [Pontixanthobacter aestiaquae]MDN3644903.1 hypothetical protein [Pontixanthobacter aestiaquae]MXO84096.1 hypothetical protein [Pontixanthobacter aestiaquae]
MMIASAIFAYAMASVPAPTAQDLANAWYKKLPAEGMAHCPAVGSFEALPTHDEHVYRVNYGFVGENSSTEMKYTAKLKFEESIWVWHSGDFPRCSIMIIENSEG